MKGLSCKDLNDLFNDGVYMKGLNSLFLAAAIIAISFLAQAEQPPEFHIIIKDHKFKPAEVIVPANTKVRLIVENQDPTPEEFESHEMHREKIIAGNKTAKILIGPLKPGKYPFFGEFNQDTAQGMVIAQ